jgi:uncharacterized protein (DUF433 family)
VNERISIDPAVCHGKPVIKNTRVLVSNVLADLAAGRTFEEIIEDYPGLVREDILAALDFGSRLARFESVPMEAAHP